MTFEELKWWQLENHFRDAIRDHPQWRRGQAWFNTVYTHYPEVADQVRGGSLDPFHRDDVIPAFLDYVKESIK